MTAQEQQTQRMTRRRGPRRSVRFRPEHLDEARQRRALIEDKLREAQQHEDMARRARIEASHFQEAFTAWLAFSYGLHPERGEQWHLDLDRLELLRIDAAAQQVADTAQDDADEAADGNT